MSLLDIITYLFQDFLKRFGLQETQTLLLLFSNTNDNFFGNGISNW